MKNRKLLAPLKQQSVSHPATPSASWELAANLQGMCPNATEKAHQEFFTIKGTALS